MDDKQTKQKNSSDESSESEQTEGCPLTEYLQSKRNGAIDQKFVEEYKNTQADLISEMNTLYRAGEYRFEVEPDVLVPVVIEKIFTHKVFYVIQASLLEMRNRVQKELKRIYEKEQEPFDKVTIGDVCAIKTSDVWYRGEVIGVQHGPKPTEVRYVVRLIDFGRLIRTKQSRLRLLKGWLVQMGALRTTCSLTELSQSEENIKPLEIFETFQKTENTTALIYLKRLIDHADHGFLNEVYLFADYDTKLELTNKAYLLHETYGAFIRHEIEFRDKICCEWFKKDSKKKLKQPPKQTSQFKDKTPAIISHIVSPSEIYFQLKCQAVVAEKLRCEIDKFMQTYNAENCKPSKWSRDDNCLVRLDDQVWYRGRVEKWKKKTNYMVYLRDHDRTENVSNKCMIPISQKFLEVPDCVQKSHLDISQSWMKKNDDDLRQIIDQYETYAISTALKTTKYRGSVGVTLWGSQIVSRTIISSLEVFIEKTQSYYTRRQYNPNCESDTEPSFEELLLMQKAMASYKSVEVLDSDDKAYFWAPPLPITGTFFVTTITQITKRGVFYIQTENDSASALIINVSINSLVRRMNDEDVHEASVWEVGSACFAKSSQNTYADEYYRATIKSIKPNKGFCWVEFIDYGNICRCLIRNLRPATTFGNIPALAHPYYLPKFIPRAKTGDWNPFILVECREQLNEHTCFIHVEHEEDNLLEIVPCQIQLAGSEINLFDWMVENQKICGTGFGINKEPILYV